MRYRRRDSDLFDGLSEKDVARLRALFEQVRPTPGLEGFVLPCAVCGKPAHDEPCVLRPEQGKPLGILTEPESPQRKRGKRT